MKKQNSDKGEEVKTNKRETEKERRVDKGLRALSDRKRKKGG